MEEVSMKMSHVANFIINELNLLVLNAIYLEMEEVSMKMSHLLKQNPCKLHGSSVLVSQPNKCCTNVMKTPVVCQCSEPI